MRVDSVSLPLRFILTGLAALVLGLGAILAKPEILTTYHYNQWVLATTHIFTLGWITSVIMGAMYQLVPVALETKLYSLPLARWQFVAHVIGWPSLVAMFWVSNAALVPYCGLVVAGSVFLFIYNMILTLAGVPRWNAIGVGIASAIAWLGIATLAGLAVAAAKAANVNVFDPLAQMHAHAHLGVVGFFIVMLVAVSYKLVPMFTLSELKNERRALVSIILLNVGLLVVAVAILFSYRWKIAAAAIVVAALGIYGREMAAIVKARQRRQMDAPVRWFLFGLCLLAPLCVLGLILAAPGLPANGFTTQLENVYGLLALAGLLTICILAMLYKIVPFLVWYYSYSRHIGRSKVPSLAELSSPRLQRAGFWVFMPGFLALCAGALFSSAILVRSGSAVLLVGLAVFAANVVSMLSHLRSPRLQPLVRPPAGPKLPSIQPNGAASA